MRYLLTTCALIVCGVACATEPQIEIIDLQAIDATTASAMFAGGIRDDMSGPLERTAREFAVRSVQQVAQLRSPSRETSLPVRGVAAGRAQPTHANDLSHLLPAGLTGPPTVAPNRNALIVKGTAQAIEAFREVLTLIDTPAPMVNIALRLDEVGASVSRNLAPEMHAWGIASEVDLGGPAGSGNMLSWGLPNMAGLAGFDRGTSGSSGMTEAQVTGTSGQPAVIAVGEVRPWFSASVYYDAWGGRHVEYIPHASFAGVTFWVLPQVVGNNMVKMQIAADFSKVAGPAPDIRAGDVTVHQMIQTTVTVADGQPLVIGGLRRQLNEASYRWPGSRGGRYDDTDSIITVTPRIIHTFEQ